MTKSSAALVEDLVVDSLGSQADGVAPGPVYVPLTLPGERVRVERHGERADLLEVLSPSADRIAPACPHYGECGGCALQHWAQAPYLAWKAEQVRLALGRERIETEIAAAVAVQPGTRRRLALHARPGKGGAKLGFKARRSWRLVDIAACSVADPRLVAALPEIGRAHV